MNWKRIGNDYLFEMSLMDKNNDQITIIQSWKIVVAIINHKTKTMIRTKKHYQYNTTVSLDKLVKQQKLLNITMTENTFFKLLCEKLDRNSIFITPERDVIYTEDENEDESNPWEE